MLESRGNRRAFAALLSVLAAACAAPVSPTEPPRVAWAGHERSVPVQAHESLVLECDTVPAAVDGRITGPFPLKVEFDLCKNDAAVKGVETEYAYDFDSDGQIERIGGCRTAETFETPSLDCVRVTICRVASAAQVLGSTEPCTIKEICR